MTDQTDAVLARIDATREAALARYFAFLRIPSVSAQPAHAKDCRAAAEWARAALAGMGFDAAVRETDGHPVVVAHHPGPGGDAPHLLYYGHYDVQPPEPLELWTSPPFQPTLVDGPHGRRVRARGAVDDKGQVTLWLEAFRAWYDVTGGLPVRVTVLLEGEEEVGSPNLEPFVAANRDALRADVAVISDTGMWDIDTPAITTRLRGMVYTQIDVKAAARDLHSGLFGGAALNPINALTRALGDLKDDQGGVRLPGFYDRVRDVPAATAAEWAALGFDEAAFLGAVGLTTAAGEHGRSPLERLWARPTADINGIWGGYAGPGAKTVIPAQAGAKVSFRLVPDQDPQAVVEGLKRFLAERLPEDAQAEVQVLSAASAIEVPTDSPWVEAARAVLAEEYGRAPVLSGSGGSIPVVDSLRRVLGLDALLMGFGLDDDQVHSPDEKFEIRCLDHGTRAHARLLGRLTK